MRAGHTSAPRPGRRDALRLATQGAHRELDALASILDLTTLADYRRFMLANAAPLCALEIALELGGVEQSLPDWPLRTRRAPLALDLAALDALAEPLHLEPLRSPSEHWGVAYVLEGSRLGAQVVLARVYGSPDERVRGATAFLSAGSSRLWPTFLRELELAHALDVPVMTRAACAAFELFRRSFAALANGPAETGDRGSAAPMHDSPSMLVLAQQSLSIAQ